ncbi:MAG: acetamidase/formamidase family protein [Ferruginibacter sp.]
MKKYFVWFLLVLTHTCFCQKFKRIDFFPTRYYSHFSAKSPVALQVLPGDTVHTGTIDCNGFDKHGKMPDSAATSNPLIGPFYVEGASKGDVLAVTFHAISFNRNYATCMEYFHPRSLPSAIAKQFENKFIESRWDIDVKNSIITPDKRYEHLKNYQVHAAPFPGCVGVAAKNGIEINSEDAGETGGNLDFSRITQGSTVYLPVYHEGALLYLGDGHAAQGDGELNWSALETSLDITFSVQVIKHKKIDYPGVEDNVYLMTVGLDSSLDNAFKIATKGLLDWLIEDYHLTMEEATQVMGSSVEYKITEVVDPKVEIAAMIKKERLKGITK